MKTWMPWVVCLALGAGCVEQPTQPNRNGASQQELDRIRRQVVTRTAPTPQHAVSFNFDNKVELLGYDINITGNTLRPGQSVTITWYWKCRAPTGDGWRLFTHLDDANGPRTNQDNVGDARRAYQPERWHAGEFIRDVQSFELPADWDSPTVRIHVGLWKDATRLPVTPADRTDGDRRARVLSLDTGVAVQVTETTVPRAAGAITADGRLDEPSWANAARTGPLVNPGNGNPAGPTEARATAQMLWDDTNLYVGFHVTDDNLVDPSTARDDHLWEHDAVEVMIDPNGDGSGYYEFQVSPRNQRFDTRFDAPHQPTPFGHMADFNPNTRSGVNATGTVGNSDDNDTGYDVELVIPWADINGGLAHMPPQAGDQVRLNLFVMDEPKTGGQRSAAWSAPRRGDFHTLERFGRITLAADAPGVPSAPAVPGAAVPIAVPSGLGAAGQGVAGGPGTTPAVLPLPTVVNTAPPARRAAPAH